ncbi:hypothetical protein HID58_029213 [Brassica napus]|uniref:Uncharacterized protein n=1 Tax=Brassica napus TaxID=3708 RepID=A0ABQ8CDD7_BRANA|nr:hypothetical protein HID58_029213 [Brassica napus]
MTSYYLSSGDPSSIDTYSSILRRHGQSHNCELLQILLCPTDLPSISRFRFVQWAQRAIDTSHVEAESNENGIGFGKLMDVTVHFFSNGKCGLLEFIEKRIKVNGHKVIVLAEEAERELMCKSMESNRRL